MDEIVVLTVSKKLSCTFVLICLFITILLIPVPSKIKSGTRVERSEFANNKT